MCVLVANVKSSIFNYSRNCWEEAITLAERCEREQSIGVSANISAIGGSIAESHYRFAMFCLEMLREEPGDRDIIDTQKLIVQSILCSMKYGSKNARFLFPQILELENINDPQVAAIFNDEVG